MTEQRNATALAALQDRFAIIDLTGEIRVIDLLQVSQLLAGTGHRELALYKRSEAQVLMRRHLEGLPVPCSKPAETLAEFWVSPRTTMYKDIAFTPIQAPASTLNLWTGPLTAVQAGNWVILRDFVRDVICAGNQETYDHLIKHLAHMIKRPEEKPGVLITLLGGQGTGKGVFFRMLRAIWPMTTLLVSDVDQVIGRFNACLERNFVICMDEALFSGDRRALDRLKSVVTEPRLQIEQKYQPMRSIESVHRFFAASNHDHFAHVERDDRRFYFLRVSNERQQDTVYLDQIVTAIKDPRTIGALVYYLKRKDLSSFNPRAKPKTVEHLAQKLKSLQGFERYWFEVLSAGDFSGRDDTTQPLHGWNTPTFMPTGLLLELYKEFNKNAQRYQTVQSADVVDAVIRLCKSAQADRQVYKPSYGATGGQRRGLSLPDLATARQEFEVAMGGEVNWC